MVNINLDLDLSLTEQNGDPPHPSDTMGIPSGTDDDAVDARVYRILGEQFLTLPEPEQVDSIKRWASEWRRIDEALPIAIEKALDRILDGCEADQETLQRAYTHLFRGINRNAPDPPYESLYVEGEFYGSITTEIQKAYRWVGLDSPKSEPPDHLGIELQFLGELMSMIGGNQRTEEEELIKARWWFLDQHLTEWLPTYHARIQREDPVEYYGGLLDLVLAVVKLHHDMLQEEK